MRIKFETATRFYEANVGDDIEDLYQAIKDGMVAMSYHKDTAEQLVEELEINFAKESGLCTPEEKAEVEDILGLKE